MLEKLEKQRHRCFDFNQIHNYRHELESFFKRTKFSLKAQENIIQPVIIISINVGLRCMRISTGTASNKCSRGSLALLRGITKKKI